MISKVSNQVIPLSREEQNKLPHVGALYRPFDCGVEERAYVCYEDGKSRYYEAGTISPVCQWVLSEPAISTIFVLV